MASGAPRSLQPCRHAGDPDWIVWTHAGRAISCRSPKRLQNLCLPCLHEPFAMAGQRAAVCAPTRCLDRATRCSDCGERLFLDASVVLAREPDLAGDHFPVDVVQLPRARRPLRGTVGTAGGISAGRVAACPDAGPAATLWSLDGADHD